MTTIMIDGTHNAVPHIPTTAPKVAGYVTGKPGTGVQWDAADWARFPDSGRVRIDQGYQWPPDPHGYDVLDVEATAVRPDQVPDAVQARIAAGIGWTTVYGLNSQANPTLKLISSALQASEARYGRRWWYGHVNCWLCDESLSDRAAALLVGMLVAGMTCVAVQWASPSSNPGTLVPGTGLTLAEADVDLSVTADSWFPPPAPAVAPVPVRYAWLVPEPSGDPLRVSSADGGKTWR